MPRRSKPNNTNKQMKADLTEKNSSRSKKSVDDIGWSNVNKQFGGVKRKSRGKKSP